MTFAIPWFVILLAASQSDDPLLALSKQAYNLQIHNQYREAAELYSTALETAGKLGRDELAIAIIMSNLGYNRQQLGDIGAAVHL